MKRIQLLLATTILLVACENVANKETAKKPDSTSSEKAFVPVDSATAAKNWQAFMTPGEEHKMMASWNGTWKTETTAWMAPDAPPSKGEGTCVNSVIFNGLHQQTKYTGNMMGMPFEGLGMMAFDNGKKVFISTWIDNMGSGLLKMEGTWDAATKSLNLSGTCTDPASGNDCTMREVYKVIDDNTHLMEMYGPSPVDGKEFKTMEIKFTRTK